jgi:hypothetical protein
MVDAVTRCPLVVTVDALRAYRNCVLENGAMSYSSVDAGIADSVTAAVTDSADGSTREALMLVRER